MTPAHALTIPGPALQADLLPAVRLRLLRDLMAGAPFQPATNLWRCVELPALAAALPPGGLGLDVGCGDGVLTRILRQLAGPSWRLVGVDPDPAETDLARASGVYERVHPTGADRIPEADGTFDFAFANSVLEHIPDVPACLAEVARCLRPGGLFAATVPAPQFHACLRAPGHRPGPARDLYLREIDQRLAHVQYWSEERWRREFRAAGLEPESAIPYLSARQVRRWEWWSNWTGGLLYRLGRRRQAPIKIQRHLGLRRGLPAPFRFLAGPLARLVGAGVLGDGVAPTAPWGCLLVRARKPAAGGHGC